MNGTGSPNVGRKYKRPLGSRATVIAVGVVVAFLATAAPLRPSPAAAETTPTAPEVGKLLPPDTTPPPEHPVPSATAAPGDPSTVAPVPPSPPSPSPRPGEELVDRRTATSKTFATEKPGEYMTELFASAVHYRDAGGRWADIDATLDSSRDGRRRARANAFGVEVADSANDAAVARLRLDADHSVGFALEGAARARGRAEGDKMTYPKVRPDADMRLTSRSTGIKEEMVLASPAAPDRFVFPLELRGLTASIDAGGDVVYRDKAGKEWARTPHGYMFDSAADPASGEPATSQGVTYALISRGKGIALEVRLDRAWLNDPARQWPITVDPELHAATGGDDTYVMSGFNRDNSYDAELKVGTYDGGAHIGRSYMRFDTAGLAGATVGRAELHLAERHSWNCGTWPEAAYRVTGDWNRGTQWPGAPVDPNWAGGVWAGGSCPNRLAIWNVTGMAAYWAAVRDPKGSISLRATNEGENNLYKKYSSIEGGNPPALHVWYSFSPVVPYAVTPAHGARVFTPSNPATAYYADGDGTPGKVLFAVYNYATQLVTAGWSGTVCSGCQGTWTIPALPDGWYQLYAIGHDGANYSPAWAGPQWFFIDTVPPAVPTNISPGPGSYVISGAAITASARYSEPYGWSGQVLFHVINASGGIAASKWSSTVASGSIASVSLGTLPVGTYSMWTYAYDGQLAWTSHTFSVAAKPGAPTGVQAQPGALSALLRWTPPATNGAPINSYTITATNASGGSPVSKTCTDCVGTNQFLFYPLTAGQNYRFTVAATNAMGQGPLSPVTDLMNALAAALLAPRNVEVVEGDRQATLSWTPPSLNVPGVTSYTVKAYEDVAVGDDIERSSRETAATTATITALRNGTPVYFTVTATTIVVAGPPTQSNTVVPFGPPFAPVEVWAERGDREATVHWAPAPTREDGTPGNNGRPVTAHEIIVMNDAATRTVPVPPEPLNATIGELSNGTGYRFLVHAVNEAGPGIDSVPSLPVIPGGRPFPPDTVTATPNGTDEVLVFWVPPQTQPNGAGGDNGSRILRYNISSSPACSSCTGGSVPGDFTSTTIGGLTPGTTYTFTVTGTNGFGTSDGFTSLPVTTHTEYVPPAGFPGRPTNVTVNMGNGEATVTWSPANPNGSEMISYTVTASEGNGFEAAAATVSGTSTSATLSGLDNSTTYVFEVVARNAVGEGVGGIAGPNSLRAEADHYMTTMTLEDFLEVKGRAPGPFDWNDDGCSVIPFDTISETACMRHDFGYRNYGNGLRLGPDENTRHWIDEVLHDDLRRICRNTYSGADLQLCYESAYLIYANVRVFGGSGYGA